MSIAGGVDWEDPLLAVSAVSPWWCLGSLELTPNSQTATVVEAAVAATAVNVRAIRPSLHLTIMNHEPVVCSCTGLCPVQFPESCSEAFWMALLHLL